MQSLRALLGQIFGQINSIRVHRRRVSLAQIELETERWRGAVRTIREVHPKGWPWDEIKAEGVYSNTVDLGSGEVCHRRVS